MALINQEGTFRGRVIDHAVNYSSGRYLQLELQLQATELYDGDDEHPWVDWTDVAENQLTAYLNLVSSKDKKSLNCKQAEIALGWSGKSFKELETMNLSEILIQFRVEMKTYLEKTRPQVTWIDHYDATPGRTVRRLDAAELRQLDAKFKNVLGGKATPASAPTSAPKGKPVVPKGRVAAPKGTVKPPVVKGKVTTKATTEVKGKMSKQEAWDTCVDLKDDKKVTDQGLADAWVAALREVVPNKTDEQVTPEEWFLVYEKVAEKTAMF